MGLWRQALRSTLATLLPRRRFLVSGPAGSLEVCLTFDDGPHPVHTPHLLDALAACRIPATFFVIGSRAKKCPQLVRRIVADGHALGHHSFHHTDPARTSARQLMGEVRDCRLLLQDLVGRDVPLFRPPKGKLSVAKLCRLWHAGQTIVLWNLDPRDYSPHCSPQELQRWFELHRLQGGDIVLMHDSLPHAASAIRRLGEQAHGDGLAFTTPLSWIQSGRGHRAPPRPSAATDLENQISSLT